MVPNDDFVPAAGSRPPGGAWAGTLSIPAARAGYFHAFLDTYHAANPRDLASVAALPALRLRVAQRGEALVPLDQGMMITGGPAWNFIASPGRIWREGGLVRGVLPFALVERGQNCTHTGLLGLSFRLGGRSVALRYQVVAEDCPYFKFDMAGVATADFSPGRFWAPALPAPLPVRPISDLGSKIDIAAIPAAYAHPENIRTYGVVYQGVNYNSGCPTRHGEYPYCGVMRLPSYSTAKSVFAALADLRLAQLYGRGAYENRIGDLVPRARGLRQWSDVTIGDALDMATGNFGSPAFGVDEDSDAMEAFLGAESLSAKMAAALGAFPRRAAPGRQFVYHSSDSFLATQAMQALLRRHAGPGADLFDLVARDVYAPLGASPGFLTSLRTDNRADGAPQGYFGLFWTIDDVARLGAFLAAGTGRMGGRQILDPERLRDSLFRGVDAGLRVPDPPGAPFPGTLVYTHGFWGKLVTPVAFPGVSCRLTVPFMSGYGGISIMPLPNGAVFYVFSDGFEYPLEAAITQMNRLAPLCRAAIP